MGSIPTYSPSSSQEESEDVYSEKLGNGSDPSLASQSTLGSGHGKSSQRKMYQPPQRKQREVLQRSPGKDTEMMGMLLHQNLVIEKYPVWNFIAAASSWLMLAGVVVLPGTYPQFQKSAATASKEDETVTNSIISSVANVPLLFVALGLVIVGALGIFGLWVKWRKNYIWLIGKVLL
jgi:hypothetical protein